jgi:hypothetical protein
MSVELDAAGGVDEHARQRTDWHMTAATAIGAARGKRDHPRRDQNSEMGHISTREQGCVLQPNAPSGDRRSVARSLRRRVCGCQMVGRAQKVQDDLSETVGLFQIHHVTRANERDAAYVRHSRCERVHNVVNRREIARSHDHERRRTKQTRVTERGRIGNALEASMTNAAGVNVALLHALRPFPLRSIESRRCPCLARKLAASARRPRRQCLTSGAHF